MSKHIAKQIHDQRLQQLTEKLPVHFTYNHIPQKDWDKWFGKKKRKNENNKTSK